jgi:hypothetical protein
MGRWTDYRGKNNFFDRLSKIFPPGNFLFPGLLLTDKYLYFGYIKIVFP